MNVLQNVENVQNENLSDSTDVPTGCDVTNMTLFNRGLLFQVKMLKQYKLDINVYSMSTVGNVKVILSKYEQENKFILLLTNRIQNMNISGPPVKVLKDFGFLLINPAGIAINSVLKDIRKFKLDFTLVVHEKIYLEAYTHHQYICFKNNIAQLQRNTV